MNTTDFTESGRFHRVACAECTRDNGNCFRSKDKFIIFLNNTFAICRDKHNSNLLTQDV